jgi:PCFT/HCP family folate transporter-like MFS transporter 1/3
VNADVQASRIILPKRTIIVEPVMIMLMAFGYPLSLLFQMFVVDKLTEEISARNMINISHHVNNSEEINQCEVNKSDPAYILQEAVQKESAYFITISTIVSCAPALFVTLFLGSYSDKAGRKFAILPPLVSAIAKCLTFLLVIYFRGSIWWLLIGSFLEGLGGFYMTALMGCLSYVSDITKPEDRLLRITIVEMCSFFSAILGPIGVGYVIRDLGYFWPFLIVLGGYLLNILYVIFLVPETVRRDPDAWFFSTEHIKTTVGLILLDNGTNRKWKLDILLFSFFISTIVTLEMGTTTLFELNHPLCWDSVMIGYYSATMIAVATIGGAVLAKVSKFCMADSHIALMAGLLGAARLFYTAFVQNTIMMFSGK